ncbi:hypothetical protein BU26DRAFT_518187 [Trematosphaeria pertusa]|uniref:Uncharacterized protein n=1 Tax=Trematosphaeria pertusa TaxID=390896 RepID=A0A6A6ILT5_9PLEO|nr:uncharacterized protein BU26DRAFT_518187 [Trematosphaeria pertusa]KAF2251554.1 hypothetical protein BU26DRAFT_518187 [Trematosphaeria pertusa]
MAAPTIAQWYPLFVTSDVPVEKINDVLVKSIQEREKHPKSEQEEGPWDNRWALIHARSQTSFPRPATLVDADFKSDFIGATVEDLGRFVKENFGEGKMGQGSAPGTDYIACEVFGVIDERTKEDDTILFAVDDLVSPIDEAKVRVEWRRDPTKLDEAIARYSTFEATNDDLELLLGHIGEPVVKGPDGLVDEEGKEKLRHWECEEEAKTKDVWVELRLRTDRVWWSVGGILYRGGMDYMIDPGDEFDENGVMKSVLPWEEERATV